MVFPRNLAGLRMGLTGALRMPRIPRAVKPPRVLSSGEQHRVTARIRWPVRHRVHSGIYPDSRTQAAMKILPVRPLYYLTNLEVLAGRILAMKQGGGDPHLVGDGDRLVY